MIGALIGTIITGAIIGYVGRAILPGAQDIGVVKTVLLGIVSAVIVALVLAGPLDLQWLGSVIVGSIVAAGLLWLSIRQGWLRPSPS